VTYLPSRGQSRYQSLVRLPGFLAALAIISLGSAVKPSSARADGAFPDAQAVLLPRDRPDEIILATNFGLVFTHDDGATWTYACESAQNLNGFRYVMGPPASATSGALSGDRIYAVSMPAPGLPVSDDDGCSWSLPGGDLADPSNPAQGADVFPDPSNAARVFALAVPQEPAGAPEGVYRSLDGGATYQGPLYMPPDDLVDEMSQSPTLTGVEVSASSSGVVYATGYTRSGDHPYLASSTDGGDSWTTVALEGQLGPCKPYLAAVDPTDARTIVLRLISIDNTANPFEALAVTHDGGQTWTTPLQLPRGSLQGFVRRQDGSLAAIGVMASTDGTVPTSYLFRSTDAGKSFSMQSLPYHGKGLAERNGTLFMATDNTKDLVALVSSQDGESWKPRLRFDQISAIRECVQATCRGSCSQLGGLIFPTQVCDATDKPVPPKGSSGAWACPGRCDGWPAGWQRIIVLAFAVLAFVVLSFAARRRRRGGKARRSG